MWYIKWVNRLQRRSIFSLQNFPFSQTTTTPSPPQWPEAAPPKRPRNSSPSTSPKSSKIVKSKNATKTNTAKIKSAMTLAQRQPKPSSKMNWHRRKLLRMERGVYLDNAHVLLQPDGVVQGSHGVGVILCTSCITQLDNDRNRFLLIQL